MNFVLLEFFVFLLPLLAFAVWEYLKVSRDLRESSDTDDDVHS